jgi:hypothetical protein
MTRLQTFATVLSLTLIGDYFVLADDGHAQGANSPPSPFFESERIPQSPGRRFPNTPSPTGCISGDCCSSSHGYLDNRNAGPSAPNDFLRDRSTRSGTGELLRLAERLSNTMNAEMRGTRFYSDLMNDAEYVYRAARRLREAEAKRTPPYALLEESRAMVAPLQRMNQALESERAATDSLRAVRDLGRSLAGWTRELQGPPAMGPSPYPQAGDSHERQGPPIPPRDDQSVSIPEDMKGIALLPASEQEAALRQRTCPVTGDPLGGMGKPIKVSVTGRTVFVCCEGCVDAVKNDPAAYLK